MSKQAEMDKMWREIFAIDAEMTKEAAENKGRVTERWKKLKRDMEKLKAEYEKVKGGGSYDSLSLNHGETMTRRTVIGDFTGKTGADTHRKLED